MIWPQLAGAQGLPRAGSTTPSDTPPLRMPEATRPAPAAPELRPPAPAPGGPAFTLRRVSFVGATVFTDADLQPLALPYIGKSVTLADLEAIAQHVTDKYRAEDFVLAQALVPVQDVSVGEVEISVLEGRIGRLRIEVDPAAPIEASKVSAMAARIGAGQPLRQSDLARVMLLLSDLPGVRAEATLEVGAAAGSTDLVISVTPTRSWDLALDADNYGPQSTSVYRVGVQGRWNSPMRIGDNLDYRLQVGTSGGLTFGRIGYEVPIASDGLRAGVAASSLEYALGGDFFGLDRYGRANVIEASLTYPLIRSRSRNLFTKLMLQAMWLSDIYGGAIDDSSDKRLNNVSVSLNYENSDRFLGGGFTGAGVSGLYGDLKLDADGRRNDALGTAGGFWLLNYNLSRLNTIVANTQAYLGVAGQLANKNLDSVMKVSLGGPRSVRAYAPGDATADEATIVNAELRYSPTLDVSLQVFYDWGRAKRIRFYDPALGTDNTVRLRGYGVGVYWAAPKGFSLRASVAWPDSPVSEFNVGGAQVYVQLNQVL